MKATLFDYTLEFDGKNTNIHKGMKTAAKINNAPIILEKINIFFQNLFWLEKTEVAVVILFEFAFPLAKFFLMLLNFKWNYLTVANLLLVH